MALRDGRRPGPSEWQRSASEFFGLTLRLTLRVPDGFGLATPQMASFKCAGPSVNEVCWIASPSMLVAWA